ncbi:YihY/virulence factor BrkB family protein [Salinibius halmophilus]|uniref:YihY/virulence factor BrkB family protein n=1 Tax=Salinibius halmophilus TaxID=1853216 RepID=UPI000E6618D6|nr:YihY/virulence factor BrkB family protein [Salinibius halmophilus]
MWLAWWHSFRKRQHPWFISLVLRLIEHGLSVNLRMQAMALVYSTLIGLVPLLAASLALLKAFGIQERVINPYLQQLASPLGEQGQAALAQAMSFVSNSEYGLLGIVGIVALLYAAITMVSRVERCFNNAWHVISGRTIWQRVTDFSGLVLLTPLLLIAALTMISSVMGAPALMAIANFFSAQWLLDYASSLLPWLSLVIAFSVIYFFIPNTKVKPQFAIAGGLVTALVWQGAGATFRAIVGEVGEQSTLALYSGFAVVMMFFIWLYLSWMIILLGAHLAFYLQNQQRVFQPAMGNVLISEQLAELVVCYRSICQQYLAGEPAFHEDGPALEQLQQAGLLAQTTQGDWLPTSPLDELTTEQVLKKLIGEQLFPVQNVKQWLK